MKTAVRQSIAFDARASLSALYKGVAACRTRDRDSKEYLGGRRLREGGWDLESANGNIISMKLSNLALGNRVARGIN